MFDRARFVAGLTAGIVLTPFALARSAAAELAGDRAQADFSRGVIAPGHPMPDMTAPTANGREFSLSSMRGHAVWINCFATWCEPCNDEMPTLVSMYKRYAPRGLRVIAISMSESAAVIPSFVHRFGIPFPVVLDHKQATSIWGITDIPTSIFIDDGGIVRKVHLGELTPSEADQAILALLAGPNGEKAARASS